MISPESTVNIVPAVEDQSASDAISFQSLLDAVPIIALHVRADGVLLSCNSRWFDYSGSSLDAPIDLGSSIHSVDFENFLAMRKPAYEKGVAFQCECRLRRRDGQYRWHRIHSNPLKGADGSVRHFIKTIVDIQSEKELDIARAELDQRVQDRIADLERSNLELEAFTYHVAHDLRAPIRAIVANARMLESDFAENLPEGASEYLRRQVHAATKMAKLVDELLKLSRLTQAVVIPTHVNLSELAAEVEVELREGNYPARIQIQTGLFVDGDERLLRLLLTNLLSNALRYSPGGGTITVGQESTDLGTTYFVSDEGIGFDMQFVDKIFQPFERLVSDTDFEGTGVGLANVRRIVEKHGGKVWVESVPRVGTKFSFTLGC